MTSEQTPTSSIIYRISKSFFVFSFCCLIAAEFIPVDVTTVDYWRAMLAALCTGVAGLILAFIVYVVEQNYNEGSG